MTIIWTLAAQLPIGTGAPADGRRFTAWHRGIDATAFLVPIISFATASLAAATDAVIRLVRDVAAGGLSHAAALASLRCVICAPPFVAGTTAIAFARRELLAGPVKFRIVAISKVARTQMSRQQTPLGVPQNLVAGKTSTYAPSRRPA